MVAAGILEGAVAPVRRFAWQPLLTGGRFGQQFVLERQPRVGELALQFGRLLLQVGEALAMRSAVSRV
jgi:hypothetical protein